MPYRPALLHLLLFSLLFTMTSCGMARITQLRKEAREDVPYNFVQTKDGQIVNSEDARVEKIPEDEIVARQDEGAYFRVDGENTYLRLMKGDLNLYYQFTTSYSTEYVPARTIRTPGYPDMHTPAGFQTRSRTSATRFFDKGLDQAPIRLTRNNLEPYVRDCSACMQMLAKYDKVHRQNKIWKYVNWSATAGAVTIALVNSNKSLSDGETAVFGTLFFGSIISGVFRHRAKGYNQWRLEDTIGVYNQTR